MPVYYEAVSRLLEPGGLFLNHGIVSLERRFPRWRLARKARRWTSFIERYVFPDGELLPPAALIAPAEAAGLETRDVESLREHYALTLRHWVLRLEAQQEVAVGKRPNPARISHHVVDPPLKLHRNVCTTMH